jgi:hypothetical protein
MGKIPLPERGQPIDVGYLYQIANAVNQISDKVNTTGFNYTTIDTPSAGKQNIRTSETRIIGGSVSVASNSPQTADSTKYFEYSYNQNFKYPPIVTATIFNNGKTPAGEAATVILTSIDTDGVKGLVRFNKAGNVSTTINLMIIGIPN